jgi:hypothetical protein
MPSFKKTLFAASLLALSASPAQAFFDGMVAGMTSVTNNLIDSGENVTITSINTTSTTVLLLSNDIGKMADRINVMADKIGVMADRIGVMADRIVLTESMMASFAHKVADNNHHLATLQYGASNEVRRGAEAAVQIPVATRVQYAVNSAAQAVYSGNPYLSRPNLPASAPAASQCVAAWKAPVNGAVC